MPLVSRTDAAMLSAATDAPIPTCAVFLAALAQVDPGLDIKFDLAQAYGRATVDFPNGNGLTVMTAPNEVIIYGVNPDLERLWLIFVTEDSPPADALITDELNLLPGVKPEVMPRAEIARILPERIRQLRDRAA